MKFTELVNIFRANEDEYLETDNLSASDIKRYDLRAFLLLNKLYSKNPDRCIIGGAGHGEIWFDVDPKEVAKNATEDDILTLIRCGVRYDEDNECFTMYV